MSIFDKKAVKKWQEMAEKWPFLRKKAPKTGKK